MEAWSEIVQRSARLLCTRFPVSYSQDPGSPETPGQIYFLKCVARRFVAYNLVANGIFTQVSSANLRALTIATLASPSP